MEKGKKQRKRKAWSMTTFQIHVGLNITVYFILFWVSTIYAIEIERSFVSTAALDLTFLFWLVFSTFIMVGLLMFSLLHEMFIKHDESGLHKNSDINIPEDDMKVIQNIWNETSNNINPNSTASNLSDISNNIQNNSNYSVKYSNFNSPVPSSHNSSVATSNSNYSAGRAPPRPPPPIRNKNLPPAPPVRPIPSASGQNSNSYNYNYNYNFNNSNNVAPRPPILSEMKSIELQTLSTENVNNIDANKEVEAKDGEKEFHEKTIADHIGSLPSNAEQIKEDLNINGENCCYVCCLIRYWCFEKTERKFHIVFGKRVAKRRLFLTIGVITSIYANVNLLVDILSTSVKELVIQTLEDLDIGVKWPDDNEGGTIFDDAFELYVLYIYMYRLFF